MYPVKILISVVYYRRSVCAKNGETHLKATLHWILITFLFELFLNKLFLLVKKKQFFEFLWLEMQNILDEVKIGLRRWVFFGVKDFFINFDFKNEYKNKFQDNNEKSWSRFKNRIPSKIDFRVVGPHKSKPRAWKLTFSQTLVFCRQY